MKCIPINLIIPLASHSNKRLFFFLYYARRYLILLCGNKCRNAQKPQVPLFNIIALCSVPYLKVGISVQNKFTKTIPYNRQGRKFYALAEVTTLSINPYSQASAADK